MTETVIAVKTVGSPDVNALTEIEQTALYSALLKVITESRQQQTRGRV